MATTTETVQPSLRSTSISQIPLTERFFRFFQHEVTALQEQISRLPTTSPTGGELRDATDHILAGISRLTSEVKDTSSYLPPHDLRTYTDTLKALSERLAEVRESLAPRVRFSFKSRGRGGLGTGGLGMTRKNESAMSLGDVLELGKGWGEGRRSGVSSGVSSGVGTPVQGRTPGEEVTEEESRERRFVEGGGKASGVCRVRNQVVDLGKEQGEVPKGQRVDDVRGSLVVLGEVDGSVRMTDIKDSVLVLSVRQFRMHDCKNVTVYLQCSSRPIIEDCSGIRFAPLPQYFTRSRTSSVSNQWDQVDDFKWLKAEPSPNWSVLPEAERVPDSTWEGIRKANEGDDVDVKNLLKMAGVPVGSAE